MRRFLRPGIVAFALLLSLGLVPAVAGAEPNLGNSEAAMLCQDGGYANYTTSDYAGFKNTGDCVSYVARGGELVPR
jgi:hypothetical protein